jgi:hypothetical protein
MDMNTTQALKTIQENAAYLAMFDREEGNEELKAALFAQMLEAKKVLAAQGVVVV